MKWFIQSSSNGQAKTPVSELVAGTVAHFFVCFALSLPVGGSLEYFLEPHILATRLVAFFPAIAFVAFISGIFISPLVLRGRGAIWIWIVGLIFLLAGVREVWSGWNPAWSTHKTVWQDVAAELFGRGSDCSGSECLYELFSTMPFAVSLSYSVGALIRRLVNRLVL